MDIFPKIYARVIVDQYACSNFMQDFTQERAITVCSAHTHTERGRREGGREGGREGEREREIFY